MRQTTKTWLTIAELADYVGVSRATVYDWRYHGTGPASVKRGNTVRYDLDVVDAWLAAGSDQPQSA